MAKSASALARTSIESKSGKRKALNPGLAAAQLTRKRKAQDAAQDAVLELNELGKTILALDCLQNLLSPERRKTLEEFHLDVDELTALVACINAETRRRMVAMGEAIESMRRALH